MSEITWKQRYEHWKFFGQGAATWFLIDVARDAYRADGIGYAIFSTLVTLFFLWLLFRFGRWSLS